jgi:hypothetical protein
LPGVQAALDVEDAADEASRTLLAMAGRHGAEKLAVPLVRRALGVTRGGDFDLARDALAAILRRLDSARDGALVLSRVGSGRFEVQRRGAAGRSYELWIGNPRELEGSCSCLDYAKASLGACKHLLAVFERPHLVRASKRPALRWDPVRPLTGPGDPLERVWLDPGADARAPRRVVQCFQLAPAARPLDLSGADSPIERLVIVELLLAACRRDRELAEPAIVPLLERERELLRREPIADRELDRALASLERPLFPYQRDGVARFLAARKLLLADDMGLGKTAQAIAACHVLFATRAIDRALVVVPAPLKPQWAREWRTFTKLPIVTVDGHPDERAQQYRRARRDGAVLLVNYEQLLRDLPLVHKHAPELVIFDEAQRIKNWQTKTAAAAKQIDAPWRLVLTGTPMENRLDELASVMECVDEHALEPRWRLASWHATRADGDREIIGARNLDTLRARLAPWLLRRIRREVLAQLPPRRDVRLPIEMTPAQIAAHQDLNQPIASIMARTQHRPLTRSEFLRLMRMLTAQRMICNGLGLVEFDELWPTLERAKRPTEALLEATRSPKLLDLRDLLAELAITQERKVVVFSQWRRMLQLAAWATGDVLAKAGVRGVFFSGEESQKRRSENLVAFHDDPRTRVLFATDAGGVGLNLQRAASCCINLELPWNPAVLEQRIGRIYRLGQELPVEVYNLVAVGGIEERIAGIVEDKRALFTGVFDGTSDEIPFEGAGSFVARVRELVTEDPAVELDDEAAGEAEEPASPETTTAMTAMPDAAPEAAPTSSAAITTSHTDAVTTANTSAGSPTPAAGTPAGSTPRTVTFNPAELSTVLSQIDVRPLADGRLALELPRPAALALGGLLRALASAVDGGPATP